MPPARLSDGGWCLEPGVVGASAALCGVGEGDRSGYFGVFGADPGVEVLAA